MKFRTTKKEIQNEYSDIVAVSYCGLQNLLKSLNADAYTCGVYGWNADIYTLGGAALVTGYRPFGKQAEVTATALEFIQTVLAG